jgi:pimeloyl-ACP methyl ester carboxylesterase
VLRVLAAISIFVLAVAACGGPDPVPSASAALALTRCDSAGTIPGSEATAEPSGDAAPPQDALPALGLFPFCGQLSIAGANGARRIQVGLVANRQADPTIGRDILVFHPGGPGVSPVDALFRDPPDVDYEAYVVVAWDGATASTSPGSCGPLSSTFATERNPFDPSGADEVGRECRTNFGAESEPGAYVAAEELEALRAGLGVETVDLLTHSYGTAVAEVYLRTHSSKVRRAVLDGPISLEASWNDRVTSVDSTMDLVEREMFGRCGKGSCSEALQAILDSGTGYEGVRTAIMVTPPSVGSGSLELSGTMLDQATLLAMRSERNWEGYLRAVDAALQGDGTAIWSIAEQNFFSIDRSIYYSTICSDIVHPTNLEGYRVDAGDSLLATYVSELAPCVAIPQRSPAPVPDGLGAGIPAVLVVASRNDVLTPLSLLSRSARLRSLPTCITLVRGHTSFGDAKVGAIVRTFLTDGDSAATVDRCGRELATSP